MDLTMQAFRRVFLVWLTMGVPGVDVRLKKSSSSERTYSSMRCDVAVRTRRRICSRGLYSLHPEMASLMDAYVYSAITM